MRNNMWVYLLLGYLFTVAAAIVALHIMSGGSLSEIPDLGGEDLFPFDLLRSMLTG